MATDWASDVRKHAPDADDAVIAGIVRHCGIALQKADSSLVSFSDPAELARVRNNFLKKKCGLADNDATLDAAIAAVGDRMKDDRTKNRVTVYYLLVERFGLQSLFVKAAKATGKDGVAATAAVSTEPLVAEVPSDTARPAAAALGIAALGAATLGTAALGAAATGRTPAMLSGGLLSGPVGGVRTSVEVAPLGRWQDGASPLGRKLHLPGGGAGNDLAWLTWLALALAAAALVWAFFLHKPKPVLVAAPAATMTATPASVDAAVPEGAGIITETRDGKPVVKVYFETGKAGVASQFVEEAVAFKTYLGANPGSSLGVSGYNDPSGNAAANAELSKKRAQAVKVSLVGVGISDKVIELIKPEAATDATATAAEARRVEVYVK